jgi:hypothetical protein
MSQDSPKESWAMSIDMDIAELAAAESYKNAMAVGVERESALDLALVRLRAVHPDATEIELRSLLVSMLASACVFTVGLSDRLSIASFAIVRRAAAKPSRMATPLRHYACDARHSQPLGYESSDSSPRCCRQTTRRRRCVASTSSGCRRIALTGESLD